jgi:predicted acylesterase/phospholipase RssA
MAATGAKFPDTDEFKDVLASEIKTIDKRRDALGLKPVRELPGTKKGADPIYDTVGLALSGGGVRSAAFCMGALQAIEVARALERIDYLSTVSGGGYIGSSLTAALNTHKTPSKDKDRPPIFASLISGSETPSVQHIRDYSNYLIPHGFFDLVQSAGIYLRGLAANLLLVFPWLLFAAGVTIWINPTRGSLRTANVFGIPIPDLLKAEHFIVTIYLLLLLLLLLVVWALLKSAKKRVDEPEVPGFGTRVIAWYLVVVFIAAFAEFQPFVIDALFTFLDKNPPTDKFEVGAFLVGVVRYLTVVLAPVAVAVGFLGSKLGFLIKRASESSKFQARALGLVSKLAIYISALAVPLLLWMVYLQLCYWGIDAANGGKDYAATGWIKVSAEWVHTHVTFLASLPLISSLYIAGWIVLFFASAFLSANGNSLHRLYRDRLSKAFLFEPKDKLQSGDERIEPLDHFPLSGLSQEASPYHLINTALNIQASKIANRRGRNADFFLFSRNYTGSETTGYVPTAELEAKAPEVDLATAMAVSGAAASANMGSATIKPWTLTLALLNVRLGFWLRNPRYVRVRSYLARTFHYLFNPYFLYEVFGLLNESRWYVYLTDGGHVENLGIYELLRRRCQLIIAVDAEADPKMNFNSLVKLERYARIDLGVRIELPWQEIRLVTLDTGKVIAEKGDASSKISCEGPHCAIGKIHYPGGEGYLLYVKASLSGDESDYVIDYKRRNEDYPHETTGDQFFSEEQFEVYRNLGFHALTGVFSDRDDVATPTVQQRGTGAGTAKAAQVVKVAERPLDPIIKDIQKILDCRKPDVLPTVVFETPAGMTEPDKPDKPDEPGKPDK